MGNCTQCHQLRSRGIDESRCLKCHEALGTRIQDQAGFHGRLPETDCGTCHKEHLGLDFALVRMDPDTFPHSTTGYRLEGAHTDTECRACHTPHLVSDPQVLEELSKSKGSGRTYLGLDNRCRSCHEVEDPHGGQFPDQDCRVCHSQEEWEGATAFDHDRTRYPLEGNHRTAECAGCHESVQGRDGTASIRYAGVGSDDCASCHDDPHAGVMTGTCRGCHSTRGWHQVETATVERRFDHGATAFPLVGAHDRVECRGCHTPGAADSREIELRFPLGRQGRSYPAPGHETCTSCHLDFHEGAFRDRTCDRCHDQDAWAPPDFDRAQHEMELRFPLTGAHAVTPCSACHEVSVGEEVRLQFRFQDPGSCGVCHREDDPHEGAFALTGCDLCHKTDGFRVPEFDHILLDRAHWTGACSTCHEKDDPHAQQFSGRDCRTCHETDSFRIDDFDHSTSRFPLDGAHRKVPCADCHRTEETAGGRRLIRYQPLEATCEACHGGGG